MPLEFRGAAVTDPPGRNVRFAGFPVGGRPSAMVVCEISYRALQSLTGGVNTDRHDLLGTYEMHKNRIWEIASRKFDQGDFRPRISVDDLQA